MDFNINFDSFLIFKFYTQIHLKTGTAKLIGLESSQLDTKKDLFTVFVYLFCVLNQRFLICQLFICTNESKFYADNQHTI